MAIPGAILTILLPPVGIRSSAPFAIGTNARNQSHRFFSRGREEDEKKPGSALVVIAAIVVAHVGTSLRPR